MELAVVVSDRSNLKRRKFDESFTFFEKKFRLFSSFSGGKFFGSLFIDDAKAKRKEEEEKANRFQLKNQIKSNRKIRFCSSKTNREHVETIVEPAKKKNEFN